MYEGVLINSHWFSYILTSWL